MATRGRTSFLKKQKEMARKDRQLRKAEIREQKKLARSDSPRAPQDSEFSAEEDDLPAAGESRPFD